MRNPLLLTVVLASALTTHTIAFADKTYGPGVTDTEIKLGQTMPYSGPVSANSALGKAMLAYFAKVNDDGGVNGRKLRLLSLDDAFSPPKTVEQTRKLIEDDNVLLMFGTLGTATNLSVQKYLNARQVPQLFIVTGNPKLANPAHFPWTMPLHYSYDFEASVYAKYLLQTKPNATIAILYQNDDFGKSLVASFKRTLGERTATMVIAEASYEIADPKVDQQVISLQASGADTLVNFSTVKAAAQAIRKIYDIGWKPLHIIGYPASSIEQTLRPAGFEKAVGLVSTAFMKDVHDPALVNDRDVRDYRAWFKKYYPDGNIDDQVNAQGYLTGQALVHVLKQCGDDLSRENVKQKASHLDGVQLPLLLPGIKLVTSPTEYFPIRQLQLVRFDGSRWVPFGELAGQ